jgi:DNA-binding MarR family transcriptional regulator
MVTRKKGTLFTQNEKTGAEDETRVNIITLSDHHFRRGEFLLICKNLARLVLDPNINLTQLDHKLIYALYMWVEANNRIKKFTQKQLGEMVHTDQAHISRGLKKLVEMGIIEIIDGEYYFDDKYVWTGGHQKKA